MNARPPACPGMDRVARVERLAGNSGTLADVDWLLDHQQRRRRLNRGLSLDDEKVVATSDGQQDQQEHLNQAAATTATEAAASLRHRRRRSLRKRAWGLRWLDGHWPWRLTGSGGEIHDQACGIRKSEHAHAGQIAQSERPTDVALEIFGLAGLFQTLVLGMDDVDRAAEGVGACGGVHPHHASRTAVQCDGLPGGPDRKDWRRLTLRRVAGHGRVELEHEPLIA